MTSSVLVSNLLLRTNSLSYLTILGFFEFLLLPHRSLGTMSYSTSIPTRALDELMRFSTTLTLVHVLPL